WREFIAAGSSPPPTPPEGDDSMPMFVNKSSLATFVMTGGMCHWIQTPEDADALGVPPPDPAGLRGIKCPDAFFKGLILVGPMPTEPGWVPEYFAAWWPDGTP